MNQLVFIQNNQPVTDSITVAEVFGKDHGNVLKDIRKQIEYAGEEFAAVNFYAGEYRDKNNQARPKFDLTEEAFTLVAMSYNTKEAVQMKVKFIQEFKRMREELLKPKAPQTPLELMQMTINQMVEQEKRISSLESQVTETKKMASNITNIISINSVDWRDKVNVILKKIAKNWTGIEPYRSVRNLSYDKLEKRAGCKLDVRLNNRKERAIAKGMSKSYVQKINKLDIIAEEKRLVEIYLQIVKEMAIQFKVDISNFNFEEVI
ncbi:hypothetical protein NG54_03210 [Heyndrickxia ginsengihumi]|uniref:Phage regulatory protein n=1 Tax=Heyndrickxia ginsengihumi TaxID=363870 RepID=A0A0A6VG01_9BACI|nr:Rha family transcriptional regulator [Heyndrickxia ginsengihumi]KHD86343.1 hypothetical protein NG54_03210 [Heyndrickxia ginsengihumi]